mgnify:CR=1 FL=1
MSNMKAVVVDHSAPGHIAIKEIKMPSPNSSEALVRVAATSLNLGEVRYARSMGDGQQIGWDIAGVVEQPAADGSGPSAGARVVGFLRSGAWAEFAAVPTHALAEIPENVSFAQAATLPVAGLTALYVLEKGKGLLGRPILVTGANGGVGLFACQLGKLMGAKVVGLIRREQYSEMVRSAGAEHVVISEDGSNAREYGPYRLIAESVGGAVLTNTIKQLAPDGICVSFGASAQTEATLDVRTFYTTQRASLYGFILFHELGLEPAGVGLARLVQLVSEGKLKTFITVEDSWERIGQVALDLWERRIAGKAVLHMD